MRIRPVTAVARALAAGALLTAAGVVSAAPQAAPDDYAPLSVTQYRTTSGSIFVGNLDSRIEAAEKVMSGRPQLQASLAEDYYLRFRILGRPADLSRAQALSDQAASESQADPQVVKTRARLLAAVHEFSKARQFLDQLPGSRAKQNALNALRFAQGAYDELPPLGTEPPADFAELVDAASRLVEMGEGARAHRYYALAQQRFSQVNPLPLAWLHTQQGILFLREGNLQQAERYFRAARERLPKFYLATEHLAEVLLTRGNVKQAAELYREVVAQTDNPEFFAQLAIAYEKLGNQEAAAKALQRAREGYREMLKRFGPAFADHAVAFHLAQGETGPALELARLNARARHTVGALLLLAQSEQAAGEAEAACRTWQAARKTGMRPPEWNEHQAMFARCQQDS